ncbi:MAG TPA: methionyl-tRNA formyltransferase, partial [Thermoguttaceae bacterium]|nr:methionyl-tRNA formyltransferase [Thermoguttaceae bacterium]
GPCVGQVRVPIHPDETAVELERRLAEIGAWLVRRVLDNMEAGQLEALPQDPSQASKAPRLKKEHGLIDWSRPALAIKNHVRAMEPWPKCYTYWLRPNGEPLRLILGPVQVLPPEKYPKAEPGTVLAVEPDLLVVSAGDGPVGITCVQPAGKKMLPARAFWCGYRIQPGDRLGSG